MSCPPLKALIVAACTATLHVSCFVNSFWWDPYVKRLQLRAQLLCISLALSIIRCKCYRNWSNLLQPHFFSKISLFLQVLELVVWLSVSTLSITLALAQAVVLAQALAQAQAQALDQIRAMEAVATLAPM